MITHHDGTTLATADYRDSRGKRHRVTLDRIHAMADERHAVERAWRLRTLRRIAEGKDLRCRQLGTFCRRKAVAPHPENGKPTCSRHYTM